MADNPDQFQRTTVSRPSFPGKTVVGILIVAVVVAGIYAIVRIQRSLDEPKEETSSKPQALASVVDKPADLSEYTLTAADLSRFKASGLSEPKEEILYNLTEHNDLIPDQGSLGGNMLFWPTESKFVGPNKVLAYYEDGHSAGRLLLSFKVDDGEISWQVEDTLPPPTP